MLQSFFLFFEQDGFFDRDDLGVKLHAGGVAQHQQQGVEDHKQRQDPGDDLPNAAAAACCPRRVCTVVSRASARRTRASASGTERFFSHLLMVWRVT